MHMYCMRSFVILGSVKWSHIVTLLELIFYNKFLLQDLLFKEILEIKCVILCKSALILLFFMHIYSYYYMWFTIRAKVHFLGLYA